MGMVSLLTGGQRELASFCSQSYLAGSGAVEKVICNSISLNQGYLVYVLINSVLHSDRLCEGIIDGSPPSEKQKRRRKKEGRHVFLCGDLALPEEMLQYRPQRSVANGEAAMGRIDGPQHNPNMQQQ